MTSPRPTPERLSNDQLEWLELRGDGATHKVVNIDILQMAAARLRYLEAQHEALVEMVRDRAKAWHALEYSDGRSQGDYAHCADDLLNELAALSPSSPDDSMGKDGK